MPTAPATAKIAAPSGPSLSRRRVVGAAAWAVPVVTVVGAAPAYAASGTGTSQVLEGDGGNAAKSGYLLLSVVPAPTPGLTPQDLSVTYTGGAVTASLSEISRTGSGETSSAVYRLAFIVPGAEVPESVTVMGTIAGYGPIASTTVPLRRSGMRDASFATGTGVQSSAGGGITNAGTVNTVVADGSGRWLVGGAFSTYAGSASVNLMRVLADGTRDSTLAGGTGPGTGANAAVNAIAVDASGRLVVGGAFTQYAGQSRRGIVRLSSSGTVDTGFAASLEGTARAVAVQSDGRVVVGGSLSQANGAAVANLVRLTDAGATDPGFSSGWGGGQVNAVAVLPDGAMIVGGNLPGMGAPAAKPLVRLLPGGALDPSFGDGGGAGFNGRVNAVAVQPDGKVVVGGAFATFATTTSRTGIARLNADGTLDTGFVPPTLAGSMTQEGLVRSVAVLPDGRVLVAGMFVTADGASVGRIVALRPNGALDSTFRAQSGAGCDSTVLTMAVAGSQAVVGGVFATYAGVAGNGLVRIDG